MPPIAPAPAVVVVMLDDRCVFVEPQCGHRTVMIKTPMDDDVIVMTVMCDCNFFE